MTFRVAILFGLGFYGGHLNFVGLFLSWQIDWNFDLKLFGSHSELVF